VNNGAPVGTQVYADCRFQITMRKLTVMQMVPALQQQAAPAYVVPGW
jgi:hypothetical protein